MSNIKEIQAYPNLLIHTDVPEVFFQPANSTTLASTSDGMTMREYVVIGICSLLLGLIYVASVFLYLYMKKRKRHSSRHSLDNLTNDINYPKNDQVTYGAPFSRVGSIYSSNSMGLGNGNESNTRTSIGSLKEDMGIVKNNPLLQHLHVHVNCNGQVRMRCGNFYTLAEHIAFCWV